LLWRNRQFKFSDSMNTIYLAIFRIIWWVVVLTLSSFTVKSQNNNLQYLPINSDIILNMQENIDEENKFLELALQTEKKYSNSNNFIKYNLNQTRGQIHIELLEIQIPIIQTTAVGPARCKINLGYLENGDYELTIKHQKKECIAKLSINEERYLLTFSRLEISKCLLKN